ncbi:MAG: protein of unknown function, putative Methyltransferase [Rhodospirillales bacterium]|nr:protein of unknown function, putative Methyltransferase [Rhodospirillales bacterium]
MRWPEALPFVQGAWNLLPKEKKFNFHARCYEYGAFVNYDCTSNGDFEGVRAQDILPLLIDRFGFSKFVAFGNLPDIFVDRAYGKNFSPDDAADRRLIDYLEQLNAHLIDIGVIKPTMMLACLRPEPVDCLYDRWSPEFSVRRPS